MGTSGMLVSEGVFAVVLIGRDCCLFGHEVCGHVVRAAEARLGAACLCCVDVDIVELAR